MVNNIAIIPARGGSKRIPKKNTIDFFGKPMIAWTIEAAINSKLFDRIVVSTDCKEIAKISEKYGIEVPFLRINNSDDITPVSTATLEALQQAETHFNESYQSITQLMANCPLRSKADICSSLDSFHKNNYDFQISCFKFGWMNPWWAHKINEGCCTESLHPEAMKMRSQDLPHLYCPTGAIWIAKVNKFKDYKSFYGLDYKFNEISWESATDIDDFEDLKFAKAVYMLNNNVELENMSTLRE